MAEYLLDSNVLIRHLRRHQPTTRLLAALVLDGQVGLATISRTELLEGMREHEREQTLRLLDAFVAFPFTSAIADLAGELLRRYRAQGVILSKPDAMIGATAIHHNLVLATYNAQHFPMPEVRLYPNMPAWP